MNIKCYDKHSSEKYKRLYNYKCLFSFSHSRKQFKDRNNQSIQAIFFIKSQTLIVLAYTAVRLDQAVVCESKYPFTSLLNEMTGQGVRLAFFLAGNEGLLSTLNLCTGCCAIQSCQEQEKNNKKYTWEAMKSLPCKGERTEKMTNTHRACSTHKLQTDIPPELWTWLNLSCRTSLGTKTSLSSFSWGNTILEHILLTRTCFST